MTVYMAGFLADMLVIVICWLLLPSPPHHHSLSASLGSAEQFEAFCVLFLLNKFLSPFLSYDRFPEVYSMHLQRTPLS